MSCHLCTSPMGLDQREKNSKRQIKKRKVAGSTSADKIERGTMCMKVMIMKLLLSRFKIFEFHCNLKINSEFI